MTDVADLQIRVSSLEATVAKRRLDDMAVAGGRAERATDGLMASMARFVSVAAAGAAVMAGFRKVISVQREFDIINAGLVTATGNVENASVAFQAIQDFASSTPYDLQQVSNAFIKLVNYGLDPSERALTAYGNTAAALGKDLGEMVQAVAQATTGEMEMLKSFGIKAKQDGDQISFIFRGVTTTVKNNAQEIERYLIALGENEFAGNMEARMATLDGAISNLGDEWSKMWLNLSQSGLGDAIADGVRGAIDHLSVFNDYLASGEFELHLASMGEAFGPWVDDAGRATDMIWGFISDLNSDIEGANPELKEALERVWRDFPANVRALVQLATTYFAASVQELLIMAQGVWEGFQAIFNDDTIADAQARMDQRLAMNASVYKDSIDWILAERDATVDAQKEKEAAADAARAAYEKEREERAKQTGDRLAGFGLGANPEEDGGDAKGAKAAAAEAKRRQREFQSLVEDLWTEEEALAESYARRKAIIEQNTSAEGAVRQELMGRLDAWRQQEADAITEAKGRELEQIRRSLLTEEQAMAESYERRRQIVLNSMPEGEARTRMLEQIKRQHDEDVAREQAERQAKRDRLFQDFMSESELMRAFRDQRIEEQRQAYAQDLIDWEEFQRNKAAIEQQYHEASMNLTREGMIRSLDIYGGMIGGLGQMFAQFAQAQGKNSEKMFRISKALNIAQAVMATAAGIMEAQKETNQYLRIAEQVRIAALGAVQVASIASQQYSGAYDKGGYIPAGKFGVVGERGMELVSGPANVTSREETSRLLRRAAEGGGGGNVSVSISVVVDNGGNAQAKTDVSGGDAEQARNAKEFGRLIDSRVRDVIVREQRQGGLLSKTGTGG